MKGRNEMRNYVDWVLVGLAVGILVSIALLVVLV